MGAVKENVLILLRPPEQRVMKVRDKPFCFDESLQLGIGDMTHYWGRVAGKRNCSDAVCCQVPPGVRSVNSPNIV